VGSVKTSTLDLRKREQSNLCNVEDFGGGQIGVKVEANVVKSLVEQQPVLRGRDGVCIGS